MAAVEPGIGNGRAEAINNKIKVTVRMEYGFRNTDNLVSLLMLRCSDCRPRLPGRQAAKKAAWLEPLPTGTNNVSRNISFINPPCFVRGDCKQIDPSSNGFDNILETHRFYGHVNGESSKVDRIL